jgi:hypothetical protein
MSYRNSNSGANSRLSKRGRNLQGPPRRRVARGPSRNANPPQIESNLNYSHKYRFLTSASVTNVGIQDTYVLQSTGGICTTVNSVVSIFAKSFKITKIEMWAPPASQGSAATISIDWLGFGNSPNIEHSDTTLSVSHNAHVVTRPPKNSLASFWQKATNVQLFILNCPANTVIDISVSLMMQDEETALTTVNVATGVLGNIYFVALDQGAGTHVIVPVSLNTTF